jgi:hypothetical protein
MRAAVSAAAMDNSDSLVAARHWKACAYWRVTMIYMYICGGLYGWNYDIGMYLEGYIVIYVYIWRVVLIYIYMWRAVPEQSPRLLGSWPPTAPHAAPVRVLLLYYIFRGLYCDICIYWGFYLWLGQAAAQLVAVAGLPHLAPLQFAVHSCKEGNVWRVVYVEG